MKINNLSEYRNPEQEVLRSCSLSYVSEKVEKILLFSQKNEWYEHTCDSLHNIISNLYRNDQEKIIWLIIQSGYIDSALYVVEAFMYGSRFSNKDILLWLADMQSVYSDKIIYDYLLLSANPLELIDDLNFLWFFDLIRFIFQAHPWMKKLDDTKSHNMFDAYRKNTYNLKTTFLAGKDWKKIFSEIFIDPETALAKFESFFQATQYDENQTQLNYVDTYQRKYARTWFDILQKEDMRPSVYEEVRIKKFHKMLHTIDSIESKSWRILHLDFHSCSHGSRSVVLDTAWRVPLGEYGNDIVCNNKDAFMDAIWEVFRQYEKFVSKWGSPYTLLLVRQKWEKNTQPPAANDESYTIAA